MMSLRSLQLLRNQVMVSFMQISTSHIRPIFILDILINLSRRDLPNLQSLRRTPCDYLGYHRCFLKDRYNIPPHSSFLCLISIIPKTGITCLSQIQHHQKEVAERFLDFLVNNGFPNPIVVPRILSYV